MKPIHIRIIVALIGVISLYILSYLAVTYEIIETWWVGPTNLFTGAIFFVSMVIVFVADNGALQDIIDEFKK